MNNLGKAYLGGKFQPMYHSKRKWLPHFQQSSQHCKESSPCAVWYVSMVPWIIWALFGLVEERAILCNNKTPPKLRSFLLVVSPSPFSKEALIFNFKVSQPRTPSIIGSLIFRHFKECKPLLVFISIPEKVSIKLFQMSCGFGWDHKKGELVHGKIWQSCLDQS